jgi:hypothetical protein
MGNILLLIAGPLAIRVLASLGIGFVSFAVLSHIASAVSDNVLNAYQGMSGPVLALATLLGVGQAFGIILGAIIARAAFAAIPRLGKITQ